ESGFFVDSGHYPERNGDGIARKMNGGVGVNTVIERADNYFAPVCHHFGYNNSPAPSATACSTIGGCTLCQPDKIVYIDELDENDNVYRRLGDNESWRAKGHLKPEVEWAGDGIVNVQMFLPTDSRTAHYAGLELAKAMSLEEPQVIHKQVMQEAEGTYLEVKGRLNAVVELSNLRLPQEEIILSADEIREEIRQFPVRVVAATVGEDEHSVGLREIIDIKHGGLEGYGVQCNILGTSVPIEKLIDAALELDATAILISTIITHADMHRINMRKLNDLCLEKGVRDRFILIGGGTQVTNEDAIECGIDAGFGRGTKGIHVASFIVKRRRERE
ncbi:MAG: OAM dimerization domain-containing protein, partial [bacterium]|nr:OAM dimerization domain-containing protein [bacterium]